MTRDVVTEGELNMMKISVRQLTEKGFSRKIAYASQVDQYFWSKGVMIWLMRFVFPLILAMLVSGCLGNRLADVRATEPRLIGNFHVPYDQLAICTQARLEEDSWNLRHPFVSQPRIELTHEKARRLIHVYAIESRSTLFDIVFERLSSGVTLVEYRRSYEGVETQTHTWATVERCAQLSETPAPSPLGS